MKFSNLINNIPFLISCGVLLITLTVFFIFNVFKNNQLKRLKKDYANFYNSRDFVIIIDTALSDWKILVYNRRLDENENNLRFSTFKQTIFKMDQGVFENYVLNCQQDKKLPKISIRHIAGSYALKNSKFFRREYQPIKRIKSKIYFRCQEIEKGKAVNFNEKISNLGEFKRKVRAVSKEVLQIQGSLGVIKIINKEKILSRYNIGITSQYSDMISKRINTIVASEDIICGKDNEYFYLYSTKHINRKETVNLFKNIKAEIETPITISGFKLPVIMNCGITFLGEFSFNVESVIFQAIQALNEAINHGSMIDAIIYDYALEVDNQRRKKNYEKIGRMISTRSFSPLYSPVINIETGKTIGYRIIFAPDSHFFTMPEVRQYAAEINLEEKLDDSLANTLFSHYFFKKEKSTGIIYIETTLEQCRQYVNVYRHNVDYKEISLALVLTDYDVFRRQELDVSLIELIKRNEIQLYALASSQMLLSDHKIFNHLDGIVFSKEILELSEKDDLYKLEMLKVNDRFVNYNYNYLAFGIDNNTKLELVNTLGIRFIEGAIANEPQTKPIAVDLNLYKKKTTKFLRKTGK